MDTQKVEQYAGVVRKVSTGLKVLNIIGIVGNAFAVWGFILLLSPNTQAELAKLNKPAFNPETIGLNGAIVGIFYYYAFFQRFYIIKLEKVRNNNNYQIRTY